MKGSGGGCGFGIISKIGRFFEEAAKGKDGQEIEKWLRKISAYLVRVRVAHD